MKYIFLPTLTLLFSLTCLAQESVNTSDDKNFEDPFESITDTIKNKKGGVLKEVVITANKEKKAVSALRSGLKPMDTPQSVQVIGAEIIEQQQAIRLSEVIKNANGIYVGSARGGAQESFFSRGYDMSANNMFKNGFRYNAGSIPEVSGLEKVEFLKGGSALLYGNVAPGGILNLVTKTPSFKSGGEITMQAGSYSYYKPSIDFYGPLNKHIAYRFNASYENSESFRDVVKNERIYVNPSFLFNVSDKTQITVQGDYLSADWTPDFGTGILGKTILDLPRNSFYGALWSTGNTKSASASVLLNHSFNENWKLSFNTSFQNYDRSSKSTAQLSNLDTYATPGDWNRGLVQNKNSEQIFGDQLSLQGTFSTGSIKHQIFTGVDYENSLATANTYAFYDANGKVITTYDTINLFTYDPNVPTLAIPNSRATQTVYTSTQRFGIYAQDLISFTEKIKLLAGLRWSWQESQADTHNLTKNPITIAEGAKRLDNAFSPKIGLVYQPTKDMSLFASYSNSFTPNTGTTVDLKPLEPSIIDQYEAGIKKDFWKGALSTNVTVYQITNSNLVQTAIYKADGTLNINPIDPNLRELSGETKSKGIEIDVTARPIVGLGMNAGYSYNDMRYEKTSGLNGSPIAGNRLARTPANTANLSFFYTLQTGILKGMSLGAIGNYIGKRVGGWNNQYDSTRPNGIWDREIPLEGYTTIDVSAGYEWKKFSILCKLSNVTNELNYTVHENYSVNPIAPRQVLTSLKYKF
ncbi:TonB-dependent siderophore receptor [Flavobacterium petrolei]|uniref:TonB-dependent siderophore receptor n=1 Tax=Flavobacterium petrolei TaxID=2259594 RepID=A0A482TRB7_9FLAO|nr:TonB-dependent siderophore receptor [Flavobacterium petrolei]RYJ52539.1 TonB-dependent siderophore receptor [Flavobacterium petrolei]